jgi:ubiquinol-cytochrome c reductase subunit 6
MGFFDSIASYIPFSGTVEAEAPAQDEVEDNANEVTKDDGAEEEGAEESKDDEQEEEEEEEEEDEVVDPAEAIRQGQSAGPSHITT